MSLFHVRLVVVYALAAVLSLVFPGAGVVAAAKNGGGSGGGKKGGAVPAMPTGPTPAELEAQAESERLQAESKANVERVKAEGEQAVLRRQIAQQTALTAPLGVGATIVQPELLPGNEYRL